VDTAGSLPFFEKIDEVGQSVTDLDDLVTDGDHPTFKSLAFLHLCECSCKFLDILSPEIDKWSEEPRILLDPKQRTAFTKLCQVTEVWINRIAAKAQKAAEVVKLLRSS
jgi:hypothetical protein